MKVLITGATGGLGIEFSRLFVQEGYDLVLVGRDKVKLANLAEELQKDDIFIKVIDIELMDPTTPQKIYDLLKKDEITIEVLINNAGFATYGKFVELDIVKELEEIEINVKVLTSLTGLFVKDMVARGEGRILNIASTAAFQPGPLMAVYYATKAYVLHFSEALHEELRGTGVSVTALCPGPTKTGFQKRAQMDGVGGYSRSVMSAQQVAKAGYEGMLKGKAVVIPGFKNNIMAKAYRFAPRSFIARITKKLQEKS